MNIIDEKIEKSRKICILGHINPDGDCIGASLALFNYINNKYGNDKKVSIYLDAFSEKFLKLPNADKISNDKNDATTYDLAIVVDSSSIDRLGEYVVYFNEAKDTLLFDHHENNTIPAMVSVVFKEAIATCEIIYNFLDKNYIDKNVAMCLYIGIATDSGIFRYAATTEKTLQIAGHLINYGFDFTKLLDDIVFDNTFLQRKAQGIAFDRLCLLCKGQVSFSYLEDTDLETLKINKSDVDNVIVYLREIADIKIAAFAYQVGNKIFKVSLRSKCNNINLAEFAKKHDGGGHMLAAGCMYYGDIDSVKKHLEVDLGEYIEESKN